jgi:hypothetical protein
LKTLSFPVFATICYFGALQLSVPTGKNANFIIFALVRVCLKRSGYSSKEHSEKKQTKINYILKQ